MTSVNTNVILQSACFAAATETGSWSNAIPSSCAYLAYATLSACELLIQLRAHCTRGKCEWATVSVCVCVCAGVSTPLEIEWIMQVAGCWQSFHLCGWNWIYAEETFSFRVKARLSIRFMRYAVACHMPHIPAARILLPYPLSLALSLALPLSRSNCKRYWRLKYLIQQLHDGKTRSVYYCFVCVSVYMCMCKCVCPSGCVCAVSWPVWLIKWRAKPTHLTPDRAKRGPFPQMSFCQAERNVRNKF